MGVREIDLRYAESGNTNGGIKEDFLRIQWHKWHIRLLERRWMMDPQAHSEERIRKAIRELDAELAWHEKERTT